MGKTEFTTPQKTWEHNIGLNLAAIRDHFLNDGFTIGTYPGHDPREDHAADFMVPGWKTQAGKAKGDKLANWLWENHAALGIWYVIWNKRIISITPGKNHWRPYINPVPSRRGTPSGDHLNHVHASWHLGGHVPVYRPPAPAKYTRYIVKGKNDRRDEHDQNYIEDGSFLWGLDPRTWENKWKAAPGSPVHVVKKVHHGGEIYAISTNGRAFNHLFLTPKPITPPPPPPPPPKPPTALTQAQIVTLAGKAGFKGEDLIIAGAVAMAESSGRYWVENSIPCIGLWQINFRFWNPRKPQWTKEWLKVPENNAAAAFYIYTQAGNKWRDWSTYTGGGYLKYMTPKP